ncbi:MAG TPA: hypothetical protein PJ991_08095 [Kiritimatiellia bacterium]|nr:hypothetical protein [Kiritimatiellia bacterium]
MKTILVASLLASFILLTAFAHGIDAIREEHSVAVRFVYADGSAAIGAQVDIFAPDSNELYVRLETDPNGCVAFVPDRSGAWRLKMDDGMGHAIEREVMVSDDGVASMNAHAGSHVNGVVAGVGAIFGIFGCAAWWMSRKPNHRSPS